MRISCISLCSYLRLESTQNKCRRFQCKWLKTESIAKVMFWKSLISSWNGRKLDQKSIIYGKWGG